MITYLLVILHKVMQKVIVLFAIITLLSSCLYEKPATFYRKEGEKAQTVRVETRTANVMLADLEEAVDGDTEQFEMLCYDLTAKLNEFVSTRDTVRLRIYATRLYQFRLHYRDKLDDMASHSTMIQELMTSIDHLPVSVKTDNIKAHDAH